MIDNFELIKPFFNFNETNGMFFHCQIVQRAKDHPEKKVKEGAIKTYFIQSREHLDRLKEEIILLCNHYEARAYINVSPKSFDKMQRECAKHFVRNVTDNIQQNPRRVLNSVAGEINGETRRWIVDIDLLWLKYHIEEWIKDNCSSKYESYTPILAEIPTNQGCHLITVPFNLEAFHKKFPEVDVHKNSMGTLLYMPTLESVKA